MSVVATNLAVVKRRSRIALPVPLFLSTHQKIDVPAAVRPVASRSSATTELIDRKSSPRTPMARLKSMTIMRFADVPSVANEECAGESTYLVENWDGWERMTLVNTVWCVLAKRYPALHRVWRLDCGGDGDCLFWVIAQGYNKWHKRKGLLHATDVRNMAADMLTVFNIDAFLNQSMPGAFPMADVRALRDVHKRLLFCQNRIRTMGATYQGETATLTCLLDSHPRFRSQGLSFAVISDYDVPLIKRGNQWIAVDESSKARRGILVQSMCTDRIVDMNSDTPISLRTSTSASPSVSTSTAACAPVSSSPSVDQHLMYLKNEGQGHWTLLGVVPPTADPSTNKVIVSCVFPVSGISTVFEPWMC